MQIRRHLLDTRRRRMHLRAAGEGGGRFRELVA